MFPKITKTKTPFSINSLKITEDFFQITSLTPTPNLTIDSLKQLPLKTTIFYNFIVFMEKNEDLLIILKEFPNEKNLKINDNIKYEVFLMLDELISHKMPLFFEENQKNIIFMFHLLFHINFLILKQELTIQQMSDFLLFLLVFYKKNKNFDDFEQFLDIFNILTLSIIRHLLSINSSEISYNPNKFLNKMLKNPVFCLEDAIIRIGSSAFKMQKTWVLIKNDFFSRFLEKNINFMFLLINFNENQKNEHFLKNFQKIVKFLMKLGEIIKENPFWNFENNQNLTFFELILTKTTEILIESSSQDEIYLVKLIDNVFEVI